MFSRLKLSVTWGPINNSSSDIYLFLFNLYLQQSIMDIIEFPYLCRNSGCCTTKLHNKEKRESYIPSTSQPLIHPNPPFRPWLLSLWAISPSPTFSLISSEKGFLLGNEGKLLLRGSSGNPGYRHRRIWDAGGGLTPLLRGVSQCTTPGEGARGKYRQPRSRGKLGASNWQGGVPMPDQNHPRNQSQWLPWPRPRRRCLPSSIDGNYPFSVTTK